MPPRHPSNAVRPPSPHAGGGSATAICGKRLALPLFSAVAGVALYARAIIWLRQERPPAGMRRRWAQQK